MTRSPLTHGVLPRCLLVSGLLVSCRGSSGQAPAENMEQQASLPAAKRAEPAVAVATETASKMPSVPAEDHWRTTRPSPGAPAASVLPKFASAKLTTGLTVVVAPVGTLPLIGFALVTQGGAAEDKENLAGLSSLTYAMLEEGAGTRSALAFSDAVADLGATFRSGAERDHGSVSIAGLRRNADSMLELLADAVMRPRIESSDFERRKSQVLAGIVQRKGSPEGLAFEALPELLYGAAHPFGHAPSGTEESVARITLSDVKASASRLLGPMRSALIVSGDITLEDALALAKKHFHLWKKRSTPLRPIPAVATQARKEILLLQKDNAPQTVVVVGRTIFGRGHPDEAAMTLLNDVFGGAFSSRLNMNLREDKGYSYGAHSTAAFRRGIGAFVAYSSIRQDATADGLLQFFKEMDEMRTRPATEEEVERARTGMIRSLPGSFERTDAVAGAAGALFLYGLPLKYYDGLPDKYRAVTVAGVHDVTQRYVTPDSMQILLVGDAAKILTDVEKLNLGAVRVR